MASAPAPIKGLIEARGLGILRADPVPEARLVMAVDLDVEETARLPESRTLTICGVNLPLFRRVNHGHFAPAILQYLTLVQPSE